MAPWKKALWFPIYHVFPQAKCSKLIHGGLGKACLMPRIGECREFFNGVTIRFEPDGALCDKRI
jgi:hypothetical protein